MELTTLPGRHFKIVLIDILYKTAVKHCIYAVKLIPKVMTIIQVS